MATNGSFYANGLAYGTSETGVGNVPASSTPTPAPSSFFQNGAAYSKLANSDALTASLATTLAGTAANATAAAASAAAAAISAASFALFAPLASPGLTGVPSAPTATVGTNTTQIATTAFVLANAGSPNAVIGPASATDGAVMRWNTTTGKLAKDSLVSINNIGAVAVLDDVSTSNERVGVGSGGFLNSNYAAFRVGRSWTNSGLSPHGFADNTNFNAGGAIGACSFDSRVNMTGTNGMDHFNSVQSDMFYNSTGTLATHTGYTFTPSVAAGTITHMAAMTIGNPTLTGAGAVTSLYGIEIGALTAGGSFNRAIYTGGTTVSEFGGNVISGTQFEVQNAFPAFKFSTAGGVSPLGVIYHDGTNMTVKNYIAAASLFQNIAGTNIIETSPTVNRPSADLTVSSGSVANRWSGVFTGNVTATGNIIANATTSGVGYGTGSGFATTQATSKVTGFTFNRPCGALTLNASALAAGATASFVMTNATIAATDVLILNYSGGTAGAYELNARCAAGSATIDVTNRSAGSLSEAIVLQFALIKAVNS